MFNIKVSKTGFITNFIYRISTGEYSRKKVRHIFCCICNARLYYGYSYIIHQLSKQNLLPDNHFNYCCLCDAIFYIAKNNCTYTIETFDRNNFIIKADTEFGLVQQIINKLRFRVFCDYKEEIIHKFFTKIKTELIEKHRVFFIGGD